MNNLFLAAFLAGGSFLTWKMWTHKRPCRRKSQFEPNNAVISWIAFGTLIGFAGVAEFAINSRASWIAWAGVSGFVVCIGIGLLHGFKTIKSR